MDLLMTDSTFTWGSNKGVPAFSKLDRFLVSHEFVLRFDNLVQCTLPRSLSNQALQIC
ncbi:hypothetical protein REPUB_Repub10bG0156100 [Reevesia pubescens]